MTMSTSFLSNIKFISKVFTLLCIVQVCFSDGYNPYTGHYYQKITTKVSNTVANAACAALTGPNGLGQGYLATFSTKLEWDWAESAGLLGTPEEWISGYNPDSDFKTWYFNTGPESGQLFYSADKGCLTYCPWGLTEPSYSTLEFYMATFNRPETKVSYTMINNLQASSTNAYLCEFGGMGNPIVDSPISSSGGLVTIRGYSGTPDQNTAVTFTQIGEAITNPVVLPCPVQQISPNNFTCLLPAGTGVYNVEITINGVTTNTTYQYLPSQISYIFRDNDQITIVGQHFGNDGSAIKIAFGINKAIQCVNSTVSVVKSNQVIICTYDNPANLTDPLSPIRLNINGVESVTNNPVVYYQNTHSFYSVRQACIPSFDDASIYVASTNVDSSPGYLGVIDSLDLYKFLKQTFPSNTGMWEGLQYLASGYIYYSGHPNATKSVTPYYTSTSGSTNNNSRFKINFGTGALLATTNGGCDSILSQYMGMPPVIQGSSSYVLPNEGGQLNLSIQYAGHIFSLIQFFANINGTIQSLPSTVQNNDNRYQTITIPAGYYGQNQFWMSVDGIVSNKISYSYRPPKFISMEPSQFRSEGGVATVVGENLFDRADLLSLVYNNNQNLPFSNFNGTAATVTIPEGTGTFSAYILLDTIATSPLQFNYVAPHIDEITSTATNIDSGYVTLTGYSFGSDLAFITIQGVQPMSPPTFITPHQSIRFLVAPITNINTISIKVGGQSSNSVDIPVHNITTTISSVSSIYFNTSGNITITGTGFGQYETNVTIGEQPCDTLFYINSTMLICYYKGVVPTNGSALPVAIFSGHTLITWDYLYFYRNNIACINDCAGKGQCDTDFGTCSCNPGFGGSDCSYPITGSSMRPTVNADGSTTLPSKSMVFNIGIKYIREVSDTNAIRILNMSDIVWQKTADNVNYTQLDDTYIFIGRFPSDPCTIQVNITIIPNATKVEFAKEPISVLDNSVKFQINISGWSFDNRLNTLQLIYDTVGDRVEPGCPMKTSLPSGNVTLFDIPILSQGVVLHGKYATRLISDTRPTQAVTVILDNSTSILDPPASYNSSKHDVQLLTAMLVPYFESSTILDPNFGLLLTDDHETVPPCSTDQGGSSKSKNDKWKVPVIVVLVVVGSMAIATVSAIYIKKRLMGRRLKDVALEKLSQLSRK
ncbi:hypothetical protein PPL_00488 [Heterostelium album PN500]|uniref:EGF-like domain-containing protein n=1 Tax=Heterostelium pallidum (strain ATCC 26659 / Pp 5 / PN500) TaxID=670386 RepID=D3AWL3_HETP5|nr:hypothetical protein PPL_00488 [Heterostelium album PN500]EFA86686.1 hypothetical protein PPL_00488 [Heterostelium album PN500]|eukprot:XP_020438790.1 hypothetical protein PPL_00488 [Heterostelium album PN500]